MERRHPILNRTEAMSPEVANAIANESVIPPPRLQEFQPRAMRRNLAPVSNVDFRTWQRCPGFEDIWPCPGIMERRRPILKRTEAMSPEVANAIANESVIPPPRLQEFQPRAMRRNSAPVSNVVRRECKFCKNNGESFESYSNHILRNSSTGVLVCPVLRAHSCEICGATGDDAHTKNYCPLERKRKMVNSLPNQLRQTPRQSDGSLR